MCLRASTIFKGSRTCFDFISLLQYCSFARDNFNFGVTGNDMKWRYYENVKGEYSNEVPDNTIMWAESNGWGFRGEQRVFVLAFKVKFTCTTSAGKSSLGIRLHPWTSHS